jgi:hypothetical protein
MDLGYSIVLSMGHRVTLACNDALMLCHYRLAKEAAVPFHAHQASQNGLRHGAQAIEESEAVEGFRTSWPPFRNKQL